MIYVDNAATSWPKPECVYRAHDEVLRSCANPGRGSYSLSRKNRELIENTRGDAAKLFNISNPNRVCFLKNATEAINNVIYSYRRNMNVILTTSIEHNSVLRPIMGYPCKGIFSDPDDILNFIDRSISLVICTIASNVNGYKMPVAKIGKELKKMKIPFMVDAAQGAGNMDIDVEEMCIDYLAFSGHKGLLGPQGTGGLYVREGLYMEPLLKGGTGSMSKRIYQPECFPDILESGTLNTPGIAAMGEGIRFIMDKGVKNIDSRIFNLAEILRNGLKEISGVRVYGYGHIASFIHDKMNDSFEIAQALGEKYQIACRGGFHCAPLTHKFLGTYDTGLVRLSPGYFNTDEEMYTVLDNIEMCLKYH